MWRWCWWIPMAIIVLFIIKLFFFFEGVDEEYTTINYFLLLLGIFCLPKIIFALFSFIPRYGTYIGLFMALWIIGAVLWGITFGFSRFRVREVVYESPDVPVAFDGYRIAQFSDSHTGVFRGAYESLLSESIDSINALNPDMICFVGDIENFLPKELEPHASAFSRLKARDGVFSIMGNHDYSTYANLTDRERVTTVNRTRELERSFGWDLLENEHRYIHRGNDSILIVGEENWGRPPFPQYGNLDKALKGVTDKDKVFSLMLSHDPTAWDDHITPVFHPNVTLSGHTHGTQFSLFGWSPSSMIYEQWGGEYHKSVDGKDMMLFVSTGFGGNFPIRVNMDREVVLITLKHSDK